MIFENIQTLCRKNRISISQLERETGLGNGTVCRWRQSDPTVTRLKQVADYFGVTADEKMPSCSWRWAGETQCWCTSSREAFWTPPGARA